MAQREHVRFGHLLSFPLFIMIYEVKLQYSFLVEAADQSAAYSKAVESIRENPHVIINGIRQQSTYKKPPSVLSSLIFGSK